MGHRLTPEQFWLGRFRSKSGQVSRSFHTELRAPNQRKSGSSQFVKHSLISFFSNWEREGRWRKKEMLSAFPELEFHSNSKRESFNISVFLNLKKQSRNVHLQDTVTTESVYNKSRA